MILSRHSPMLACCYLLLHHPLVSCDDPCLRLNYESKFGWLTMVNHMRSSEPTYFAFQDSHSLERRQPFIVSTLAASLSFRHQY